MCTIRNPHTITVLRCDFESPPNHYHVPHVTLDQYNELLRKYDARGKQLVRFKAKILRLYRVIDVWRNRPGH